MLADIRIDNPVRLDIYKDLIDALALRESGVAMEMNMLLAFYSELSSTGYFGFKISEEMITAVLEPFRVKLETQVFEALTLNMIVSYESLSETQFLVYASYLETQESLKLYNLLLTAFSDILVSDLGKFGIMVGNAPPE